MTSERFGPSSEKFSRNEGLEKGPRPTRLIVVMSGASMAYEIDPERRIDPDWEPGPRTNKTEAPEWKFPLVLPQAGIIEPDEKRGTRRDISGGWARMRALSQVFEQQPKNENVKILVTGGMEEDVNETGAIVKRSRADEAARVLVNRYGVPEDGVVSIGGPGSTLGNSAAASDYINRHPELGDVREVEAVTNDYHMLRTWIMFSAGFLKTTAGKEFDVTEDDKHRIKEILDSASMGLERDDWKPEKIKETREAVMSILRPYFASSTIQVKPLVAEEVLDVAAEPEKRYASRLRTHPRVRDMLKREYQGIKDLLDKKYRGKF